MSRLTNYPGELPVLFITGNSRSGTTMMMRILDNHSLVHSINEPHFFEKLWSPDDSGKTIAREEAFELCAKLLTGQRDGFFEPVARHREKYRTEINDLLGAYAHPMSRMEVYRAFMHNEARLNGKQIPCEKTPQNVFYIQEILDNFPNARIVNMIRDPRGVMLSQKRKWKRKYLGAHFITPKEQLRLRINYHPVTISRLWNSAVGAVQAYANEPRVANLRFEDLLAAPESTMEGLCGFLGIPYEKNMLLVPHAGSSSEADQSTELGIRKTRARSWTDKGLTPAEIHICQNTCRAYMEQYGYSPADVKAGHLSLSGQYISFPVKLGLALVANLGRMRNIVDTLRRRWKTR